MALIVDQKYLDYFAKWLSVLRKRLNISQQEFADLIGARVETVSRWGRAAGVPTGQYMMRVLSMATTDEIKALMSRAVEGMDDTVRWAQGPERGKPVRCKKCNQVIHKTHFASAGMQVPPDVEPNQPWAISRCYRCQVKGG